MSRTVTNARNVVVDALPGRSAATVRMYCVRLSRSKALLVKQFGPLIPRLPVQLQTPVQNYLTVSKWTKFTTPASESE